MYTAFILTLLKKNYDHIHMMHWLQKDEEVATKEEEYDTQHYEPNNHLVFL